MSESSVKNAKKTQKSIPGKPFKRGNPGRPKGTTNKFTDLKKEFLAVFEKIEKESKKKNQAKKIDGLFEWATKNSRNQGLFYQMISKMLPSNVDVKGSLNMNYILSDKFLPEGSGAEENGKKP